MVLLLHESDPRSLIETRTNSDHDDDVLFEFFRTTEAAPELCAADDVIDGGKLLPLWAPPPPQPRKARARVPILSELDHRRSSSLGDPLPPARPETRTQTRRSSSSGDRSPGFSGGKITGEWEHRKLKRVSESKPDPRANPRPPRWYVLVSGPVRINNHSGMDMKQIRIRQHRRQEAAAARDSRKWGPWKLVQSLSCKGIEAVNIVA